MNLTVAEIKEIVKNQLDNESVDEQLIKSLAEDPRVGVQKIYQYLQRRREKLKREYIRLQELFKYERELVCRGKQYIAGVDEAGRGPLAGPVVAAAVILPPEIKLYGLNDSKKLSADRRRQLAEEIKANALCWATGEASVEEICRLNIYRASMLAMKRAVDNLTTTPQHVLIDGINVPTIKIPQTRIVGGDGLSASIAAASIMAKTHRDKIMEQYHNRYPQYGFDKHKGYPTAEHLAKLRRYGPSAIHRTSFGPVAEVISKYKKTEC
uniref:ribonuclease HII n=1 Tax=Desulforadius tongensis TaxID=1216062 RepID=UPI0030842E4F